MRRSGLQSRRLLGYLNRKIEQYSVTICKSARKGTGANNGNEIEKGKNNATGQRKEKKRILKRKKYIDESNEKRYRGIGKKSFQKA